MKRLAVLCFIAGVFLCKGNAYGSDDYLASASDFYRTNIPPKSESNEAIKSLWQINKEYLEDKVPKTSTDFPPKGWLQRSEALSGIFDTVDNQQEATSFQERVIWDGLIIEGLLNSSFSNTLQEIGQKSNNPTAKMHYGLASLISKYANEMANEASKNNYMISTRKDAGLSFLNQPEWVNPLSALQEAYLHMQPGTSPKKHSIKDTVERYLLTFIQPLLEDKEGFFRRYLSIKKNADEKSLIEKEKQKKVEVVTAPESDAVFGEIKGYENEEKAKAAMGNSKDLHLIPAILYEANILPQTRYYVVEGNKGKLIAMTLKFMGSFSGGGGNFYPLVVYQQKVYSRVEDSFFPLSNKASVEISPTTNKALFNSLKEAYESSKARGYLEGRFNRELMTIEQAQKDKVVKVEEIRKLYKEKNLPENIQKDYETVIDLILRGELGNVIDWRMGMLNNLKERKRMNHPYQGADVTDDFLPLMNALSTAIGKVREEIFYIRTSLGEQQAESYKHILKEIEEGTFFQEKK